ncbi:hypothetical protein AX16_005383 [Volvariella volvacea WC 439]|nr:hypothetical protein AX16_005383 [Volvariella volvacea WC 439]
MTTPASLSPIVDSSASVSPAIHVAHRVFIGPMPEKVVHLKEAAAKQCRHGIFSAATTAEEDERECVRHMLKDHARAFFLSRGGREENWDENEEQNALEEMSQCWHDSDWGTAWRQRRKHVHKRRWVGGSFEVGNMVGVNVLDKSATLEERVINQLNSKPVLLEGLVGNGNGGNSQHLETSTLARVGASIQQAHTRAKATSSQDVHSTTRNVLAPESTSFIPPTSHSSPAVLETVTPRSKAQGRERRQVHYLDGPTQTNLELDSSPEIAQGSPDSSPTPSTLWSSNVSPVIAPQPPPTNHGELVLRDRMLIRACYSESPQVVKYFDEATHRTTRGLTFLGWGEYLVAWRGDRIEIYDDYVLPGKEWITGHKHLAFVIPLSSSQTRLSLYSFVDLTFSLTCPPTSARNFGSKSRWFFQREKGGTNIFVFKLKCRSRAYDWLWLLWRYKGGQLPKTIEVRNPRLDSRVRIDIPANSEANMEEVYKIFSRDNIVALCIESLRTTGDWNSVIERQIRTGKTLELAWRVDTNLDWIYLEDSIEGGVRKWAVLCGLVLQQPPVPAYLELRLAEHEATRIRPRHGEGIDEPPGIEGYVVRIRPKATPTRRRDYLATHNGYLFILSPASAHPPPPPGIMAVDDNTKQLRNSEVERGASQIAEATGVCDLRNIILIRRAFQLVPDTHHVEQGGQGNVEELSEQEATQSDEEDSGGEEHFAKSTDKPRLRMKRAFELLLRNGRVIRFEAHSRRVALEWIQRLRALIHYWKERRQLTAREQMDLANTRRPRVTPYTHACKYDHQLLPEAPVDASAPLPGLTSLFNWCVIDGCKPIIRGGKVYMRHGFRGSYKPIQLFLMPGYLVHYQINSNSVLHRRTQKTNLADAYVYSGYLAALTLPSGEYDPNRDPTPRRYSDGLETNDTDEDTLCTIWYNPQAPTTQDGPQASTKAVPALSYKRQRLVIRSRSRLERDAWCWALNHEIERLARKQRGWEEQVRSNGVLLDIE